MFCQTVRASETPLLIYQLQHQCQKPDEPNDHSGNYGQLELVTTETL